MKPKITYNIIKLLHKGIEGPIYLVDAIKEQIEKTEQSTPHKIKTTKTQMVLKKLLHSDKIGILPSAYKEIIVLNNIIKNPLTRYGSKFISISPNEGDVLIYTEYIEGDIGDILWYKTLSLKYIKQFMSQILFSLVIIHSHGIIHNDIKPENVIYKKTSNEFSLFITDFGICQFVSFPNKQIPKIFTSHHYTPPEYSQHKGVGKISLNSDMYNLGVMFYYMIDKQAYVDHDDHNVFDKYLINWDKVQKTVGEEGSDLLSMMLINNPDDRISSLKAIRHSFLSQELNKEKEDIIINLEKIIEKENRYSEKTNQTSGSVVLSPNPSNPSNPSKELNISKIYRKDEIEPSILDEKEYLNQSNELLYLPIINKLASHYIKRTNFNKQIPEETHKYIIQMITELFWSTNLKYITFYYALYILWLFINRTNYNLTNQHIKDLFITCLFISTKVNENENISILNITNMEYIILLEKTVFSKIYLELPTPQFISVDGLLYKRYLDKIYLTPLPYNKRISIYNEYFKIQQQLLIMYTSAQTFQTPREEIVDKLLEDKNAENKKT